MKIGLRIASAVGAVAIASITLAGCGNPNNTEYRVIDRFQMSTRSKTATPKPNGRFFLWVKPWDESYQEGQEPTRERKGTAKDIYIDEALWNTCWMGDRYTVRVIGTDTCERTPESVEPTSERVKHDPVLAKKLEDQKKEIEKRQQQRATASPTPTV